MLLRVPSSPMEHGKIPMKDKNLKNGLNLTNALLDMMLTTESLCNKQLHLGYSYYLSMYVMYLGTTGLPMSLFFWCVHNSYYELKLIAPNNAHTPKKIILGSMRKSSGRV